MQSIETTQVDQYAQTMLKDRSLSAEERARSAAAAMHMHVMTEFGLPIGTPLPMSEGDEERAYWQEISLDATAAEADQRIVEQSLAAFEWMEDAQEPEVIEGLLKLAQEVMSESPMRFDASQETRLLGETKIELTHEGNTPFYNDDKDEQQ